MNRQHYLDAIETVLAWDLSEESIADAIKFNTDFEIDAWDSYLALSEYMH